MSESSQAQTDSALDKKILAAEDVRALVACEEKLPADLLPVLLVAAWLGASVSGQTADSPRLVRRHADSLAAEDVQIPVLLTLVGIPAADIALVRIPASVGSLAAEDVPDLDLAVKTLVDTPAAGKVLVRKLAARRNTLAAETARVRMLMASVNSLAAEGVQSQALRTSVGALSAEMMLVRLLKSRDEGVQDHALSWDTLTAGVLVRLLMSNGLAAETVHALAPGAGA